MNKRPEKHNKHRKIRIRLCVAIPLYLSFLVLQQVFAANELNRKEFLESVEKEMERVEKNLTELRKNIDASYDEAKFKTKKAYRTSIRNAETKYKELRRDLKKMKNTAETEWKDLKTRFQTKMAELETDLKDLSAD